MKINNNVVLLLCFSFFQSLVAAPYIGQCYVTIRNEQQQAWFPISFPYTDGKMHMTLPECMAAAGLTCTVAGPVSYLNTLNQKRWLAIDNWQQEYLLNPNKYTMYTIPYCIDLQNIDPDNMKPLPEPGTEGWQKSPYQPSPGLNFSDIPRPEPAPNYFPRAIPGLANQLAQALTEAFELGLVEFDVNNELIITGATVTTLTVLARQQAIRSGAWSIVRGGRGFALPAVILSVLTMPLKGSTYPFNHVREKPWIFPTLPENQQQRIVEDHPDVVEIIENFNMDLLNIIREYRNINDFCPEEGFFNITTNNNEPIKVNICNEDGNEVEITIKN